MYAFISYNTDDKKVAGRIKNLLSLVGVESFLAHEDIEVSEEWAEKILEEIGKADVYICILSKRFFESYWCNQESGIAAFREEMTVIPISIDGSNPQGFIAKIQATKVDPQKISISDLIPGFLKHDFNSGIDIIINTIGKSGTYRGAEEHFQLILPHIGKLSDKKMKRLLEQVVANNQVHDATLCAREYIPPLIKSHGHLLSKSDLEFLKGVCNQYSKDSSSEKISEEISNDETELFILQKAVEQHKKAETDEKLKTNKCAKEIDISEVLDEITGESGASLEYITEFWLDKLAPPGKPPKGPLQRCSNTELNNDAHKYHVRAFTDPHNKDNPTPAWDRIQKLKGKFAK